MLEAGWRENMFGKPRVLGKVLMEGSNGRNICPGFFRRFWGRVAVCFGRIIVSNIPGKYHLRNVFSENFEGQVPNFDAQNVLFSGPLVKVSSASYRYPGFKLGLKETMNDEYRAGRSQIPNHFQNKSACRIYLQPPSPYIRDESWKLYMSHPPKKSKVLFTSYKKRSSIWWTPRGQLLMFSATWPNDAEKAASDLCILTARWEVGQEGSGTFLRNCCNTSPTWWHWFSDVSWKLLRWDMMSQFPGGFFRCIISLTSSLVGPRCEAHRIVGKRRI